MNQKNGYCTPADVIASFNELRITEMSGDTNTLPDNDVIQGAINFVSGRMDSYLMTASYVIPVTTPAAVMGVLKVQCVILTIYRLLQESLLSGDSFKTLIDDATKVIDWLKDVAAGKILLPGALLSGASSLPASDTRMFSDPPVYIADPVRGPTFL